MFSFSSWFSATEAEVVQLITNIKADVAVAEADINKALKWIAGEVPTIVNALQVAVGLASAAGVVTAPELVAANAAVTALNAFAAAQNENTSSSIVSDAQSVVTGYVALQQALSAVSQAKATAASATAVAPASSVSKS